MGIAGEQHCIVLVLPLRPVPVDVDSCESSRLQLLLCRLQGLVLSLLLFDFYLKLLDEVIHCPEVKYHQYAIDVQLYISTSGKLNNGVSVLFLVFEDCGDLDGEEQTLTEP